MSRNILLHICCGPCLIYPLQKLRSEAGPVDGFWYNPNIAPPEEKKRRLLTLRTYAYQENLPLRIDAENDRDAFLKKLNETPERPQRCARCWYLRLKKTAESAAAAGYERFSSTLLVSPYQDIGQIQMAGRQAAEEAGVEFIGTDFREGYRLATDISRKLGMYRQKYCGCLYSLQERTAQKKTPRVG